jgi:hypothetical protein
MATATAIPVPRLIGIDGLGTEDELARVFATFNAASPALAAARREG